MAVACAAALFAQEAVQSQTDPAPAPEGRVHRGRLLGSGVRSRRPGGILNRSPFMGRGFEAKPFGKLSDGRETKIWRLQNASGGLILDVTDYGGRVVRVYTQDKFGNLADITLGFNSTRMLVSTQSG